MANSRNALRVAGSLVVAWALAVGVSAQAPPEQKTVPSVKAVRSRPIASIEGKENFDAYCAVCHGRTGRGDGPAAPAMKVPVPDLTTLAARNSGMFDPIKVERVVKGTDRMATPAHGIEDMPIWGDVFKAEDPPRIVLRVNNLVKYVQSIQARAAAGSSR